MHNMEIYCTRLVQYGFSIQYRLVQYLSILYIILYNNLLILHDYLPLKLIEKYVLLYNKAIYCIIWASVM